MYRIGQEEIDAVSRVIKSRQLFRANDGPQEVKNFEKELACKVGSKYALCLSGGTSALTCALVGLGVGPGDEVIIPAYTFMATAIAVTSVGAVPVLAEVDETMTIDLDDVERKLTPDVKAVIPVHMVGFPCDMKRLVDMSQEYGFKVIEDACQADGGSFKGKRLGTWGDAGTFSFNFFKIISAGEGGAVVTDDRQVYERALIHHDGGAAFRPDSGSLQEPVFLGTQYRVSEITGAVLRVQLERLDGILSDLRKHKSKMTAGLKAVKRLKQIPSHDPEGDCSTTFAIGFDSEEKARRFSDKVGGWLPIDSGKHVYLNWGPLLSGRAAHNKYLDPLLMEQNKGLRTSYSIDMCPQTLDVLARTVYINIDPDWTEAQVDEVIENCRNAVNEI